MNLNYITFIDNPTNFTYCFLTKIFNKREQCSTYVEPYNLKDKSISYRLYSEGKTTPVKKQKEFLNVLLPELAYLNTKYLIVTDAAYFKTLTGMKKADSSYGYVLPCVIKGFEYLKVIIVPNLQVLFYKPQAVDKIKQGMEALLDYENGVYTEPGKNIVHYEAYPNTIKDITYWLNKLIDTPLAMDIEAFSLKHWSAGIGTISLAWNEHEGIAFNIDYGNSKETAKTIRQLLKGWFEKRTAQTLWHNISYDGYVLVYQLWMKDLLDNEGLLNGLEHILRNLDDTLLISYLATNSCGGNALGLKAQSQEYTGNYAVADIDDITKIPINKLLTYNLKDSLATWYVYNKHMPTVIKDKQLDIYKNLFKPAIKDIIQMQLTGLPLDMNEVKHTKEILLTDYNKAKTGIANNPITKKYNEILKENWVSKKNSTYKVKQITIDDVSDDLELNPNSGVHLQDLLYNYLGLPILDRTKAKQPATGAKTLAKLVNHTKDKNVLNLLQSIIDFKAVDKILNTFIVAFEEAPLAPNGWHYLFGNFHLGGTVSGRLSSSNPNLQNIPATGSKYAKVVKKCFRAPKGYLLIGLDFSSLEDRISAVTTKDPQKIKVYTDHYDGHCLRAYAYFGKNMPDIDPNSVKSINSIKERYKSYRQSSKPVTFALTYQGTAITLVNNCGFSMDEAKYIEEQYHKLYSVSDAWVKDKLSRASKDGYVTVAFGLRVRTPILSQTILGNKSTPFEAEAEGRTAGNALGQSWGLLNSRAVVAFMNKVRVSKYRNSIFPCGQIHDASYYIVKDDIDVVDYVNTELVKEVNWQEHPDIKHDKVKLGGELSVFFPNWSNDITIPNYATKAEIKAIAKEGLNNYLKKAK